MKLAVFFPGMGYTIDKPLLYYSRRLVAQYQYELLPLTYTELGENLTVAFQKACEQTEKQLAQVDWQACEEILFVSKSIGTVVAADYAAKNKIVCRNVYYTPVEHTFRYPLQPGIVFHGNRDPLADTALIKAKCEEQKLPIYIIEEGNHSLEVGENVQDNLKYLMDVVRRVEDYISQE